MSEGARTFRELVLELDRIKPTPRPIEFVCLKDVPENTIYLFDDTSGFDPRKATKVIFGKDLAPAVYKYGQFYGEFFLVPHWAEKKIGGAPFPDYEEVYAYDYKAVKIFAPRGWKRILGFAFRLAWLADYALNFRTIRSWKRKGINEGLALPMPFTHAIDEVLVQASVDMGMRIAR